MLTQQRRKARSDLANQVRKAKRLADPESARVVDDARRHYRVVAAEDYIRELVDTAPALTAEQRDSLALLLRPSDGAAA